ncbi:MAG: hypothetical protein LBG93_09575 [Treponema sp.]|jgi:hypothetical protein|nr:hypothetical protein [Treponema sp.]
MLQFYFLSIALNALAGYILISGSEEGPLVFRSGFSLNDETFKLVVGVVSSLVGLMKILSVVEGDVPVIGDLLPAVAGILAGFTLIFEYYRSRTSLETTDHVAKIDRLLAANKKVIGVAAIVSAVLHFLFPRVLLL